MDIHPYASIFLTPDPAGCIDGIQDACRSAGFHVDTASARPDHLGIGLMLLSFLTGATADALTDDRADTGVLPQLPPLHERPVLVAHRPSSGSHVTLHCL